ncbi:DMT family transporter [Chitinimonas koreensis]|uniref:DMT family transporter n=1 Tax=Chitinimonas koreensis TaxID=356302 RepID=UPI0004134100|nr:DMT family transporter [Chitinimonas koreensis]QNM95886.1 DMT family transporter [Chitinimonas koreensis]
MIEPFLARWRGLAGNTRGVLLVMLAMLCWSVLDACNKELMQAGIAPNQVLFLQATVVLAMIAPVALWSRGRLIATRKPQFHLLRALFIVTSAWCAAWAVSHLPLAEASAYLMTASLFMLPLGVWLLGEQPHWLRWLGVLVGFGGVLAILRPGIGAFQPAALVALFGAFMEAMLGVVLKKYSADETATAVLTWSQVACWFTFGLFSDFALPAVPMHYWLLLPVIGISAAGIYLSYFHAYRAGDASAVEAGSFSLLLFSPALGFLFFAEVPAMSFWLGAGLLVAGIALVIVEPSGHAAGEGSDER